MFKRNSGRCFVLVMLAVLGLSGCAKDVTSEIKIHLMQADDQFERRNAIGALESAEEALSLTENAFGENHCDVRGILLYVAGLNNHLKRYDRSIEIYHRVLKMDQRRKKPNPRLINSDYWYLAGTYRLQGDFEKSEYYYKRGMNARAQIYGVDHPRIAAGYRTLGGLYQEHKHYTRAMDCFRAAYEMEKKLDPNHSRVGRYAYLIAENYRLQGEMELSENWHLKALKQVQQTRRPNHPSLMKHYRGLVKLYRATGDAEKAAQAEARIVAISLGRKP